MGWHCGNDVEIQEVVCTWLWNAEMDFYHTSVLKSIHYYQKARTVMRYLRKSDKT
jgi:hypothetical protein